LIPGRLPTFAPAPQYLPSPSVKLLDLRLDPNHIDRAISALRRARSASEDVRDDEVIRDLAACLSSAVGASKMLHFVNPETFPIWDTKVERIHSGTATSQYRMRQTGNYIAYLRKVHATRRTSVFPDFFKAFGQAYQERLLRLGIAPYRVTEVRAIEAAAFELAGNDGDNDENPHP